MVLAEILNQYQTLNFKIIRSILLLIMSLLLLESIKVSSIGNIRPTQRIVLHTLLTAELFRQLEMVSISLLSLLLVVLTALISKRGSLMVNMLLGQTKTMNLKVLLSTP